jgi:predicted XRE-type DNA-binding protein
MAKKLPRLTYADAITVWLMRWAGNYQHDIAAHFGENQGRISEILNGKLHPGSEDAARRTA